MKKRMLAGALSLLLLLPLLLSGCNTSAQATDMMAGIKANPVNNDIDLAGQDAAPIANFGVQLFQNSMAAGSNTLVSPLSVLCALAMTANGAQEETLTQMEDVFGLSVPELNQYLHAYKENLPTSDKYKVNLTNSIWFKDDEKLSVEQKFLQTNADYYDASIYKAPFDESTLKAINSWVSDNTDGMIKNILNEIPTDAVMYLINALAFDAEWENIYKENQVRDGTFTTESGQTRQVKMMYGEENQYLDDGSATGFIKYYADRKYAFVALLPNEGLSIADYAASLTGEKLLNTIKNAQSVPVNTAIPQFKSEYAVEMSDILKSMGMTDAFDADLADFTGLGKSAAGNIFISRVLHKTYIAVDEKGTRAGAATLAEMSGCAAIENPKTVYLDRPFVYMLIDCQTNLPLFLGVMMDTNQ